MAYSVFVRQGVLSGSLIWICVPSLTCRCWWLGVVQQSRRATFWFWSTDEMFLRQPFGAIYVAYLNIYEKYVFVPFTLATPKNIFGTPSLRTPAVGDFLSTFINKKGEGGVNLQAWASSPGWRRPCNGTQRTLSPPSHSWVPAPAPSRHPGPPGSLSSSGDEPPGHRPPPAAWRSAHSARRGWPGIGRTPLGPSLGEEAEQGTPESEGSSTRPGHQPTVCCMYWKRDSHWKDI